MICRDKTNKNRDNLYKISKNDIKWGKLMTNRIFQSWGARPPGTTSNDYLLTKCTLYFILKMGIFIDQKVGKS